MKEYEDKSTEERVPLKPRVIEDENAEADMPENAFIQKTEPVPRVISKPAAEEAYLNEPPKRKKKNASASAPALTALYDEYPLLSRAVALYRGFKQENAMPDNDLLKEKDPDKSAGLFPNEAGHNENLNDAMVKMTGSLSSAVTGLKEINDKGIKPGELDAEKIAEIKRHLSGVYAKLLHVIEYFGGKGTAADGKYKKELLALKAAVETAMRLADRFHRQCFMTDAEMPLNNRQETNTSCNLLLYDFARAKRFFTDEKNKKPPDTVTRIGSSSNVTGRISEKRKAQNLTKAQITERAIEAFEDIIESEDKYAKAAEHASGPHTVSFENIRIKYANLQQFLELYGIGPEHLISEKITGRKPQMTALARHIAY